MGLKNVVKSSFNEKFEEFLDIYDLFDVCEKEKP